MIMYQDLRASMLIDAIDSSWLPLSVESQIVDNLLSSQLFNQQLQMFLVVIGIGDHLAIIFCKFPDKQGSSAVENASL